MEATLNGPHGRTVLGSTPLTLGRAPDNQIVLNDVKASGHHLEIRPSGQGYSIIDLGSTNGTLVNGQQLVPNTPRTLNAFDVIRIGDASFNYEVSGPSQVEPTVYATPPAGSSPDYQPTVAAPPPGYQSTLPASPPTAYGSTPQEYQAYEYGPSSLPYQSVPESSYPPPPSQQPPYGQAPYSSPQSYVSQPVPGAPAYGDFAPPAQPAQLQRRGLSKVTIGVIAAIVVIIAVAASVYITSASTPTKTLNAYCDALVKHDYHAAYGNFSQSAQSSKTESDFTTVYSTLGITTCNVTDITQSGSTATALVTYGDAQGDNAPFNAVLINENNSWKINSLLPK